MADHCKELELMGAVGIVIHLSAFVDCRFLARMRPIPSQVSFMKSLVAYESNVLEVFLNLLLLNE